MGLYERLQTTADRLLKGKGQSVTITKRTAGAYNPATGTATVTTTTETGTGAIFDYGTKQIDGTLIKVGDKQLLLSAFKTDGTALSIPSLNDTVTDVNGTTYTLVKPLKAIAPAGTIVMYDCNIRGAA